MISLYTFTMGRSFYLHRFLRAIVRAGATHAGRVEHHLCCQGVDLDPEALAITRDSGLPNLRFEVHRWPENIGLQAGINRIVPQLQGDLIVKIDDDCLILSDDFFDHVRAVARLEPRATFSPYPVGLIGTPGGPAALDRHVRYSAETDTYYTFRRVDHVGGLCRISPASLVREWRLEPGRSVDVRNEDTQMSRLCRENGIAMFYLENALVVEHQESTLGQEARYQEYFAKRLAQAPPRLPRLREGVRAVRRSLARMLPPRR